jgi:hypothetical protein
MAGAIASVQGIFDVKTGIVAEIKSLQELHNEIYDA